MTTVASIPVDLMNGGQVFACLGFLEAAQVLIGDMEGGFDWSRGNDVKFELLTKGAENPFAVVLAALASSQVREFQPPKEDMGDTPFPSPKADRTSLPVRLIHNDRTWFTMSHWTDGSSREAFKLYAGNRTAGGIAHVMLHGESKTKKGGDAEPLIQHGVASLWRDDPEALTEDPFGTVVSMGGSFNFDPRGAWTGMDLGFSLNRQKHIKVTASPVVEILAAMGLEHARPIKNRMEVRYGAWGERLPPMLARPALGCERAGAALRTFAFTLRLSGENKVITFAEEEAAS